MCHQTVGLLGGVLEERGISTVSLSVCRKISQRLKAPRTLVLPYPFGYPLGAPGDSPLQLKILREALKLLRHPGPPPIFLEP